MWNWKLSLKLVIIDKVYAHGSGKIAHGSSEIVHTYEIIVKAFFARQNGQMLLKWFQWCSATSTYPFTTTSKSMVAGFYHQHPFSVHIRTNVFAIYLIFIAIFYYDQCQLDIHVHTLSTARGLLSMYLFLSGVNRLITFLMHILRCS